MFLTSHQGNQHFEQNVNIMKEWMALQGFEDILQILGSLYRDPDGRMDNYEPYYRKTSTHDWADLLLLEISVLLCSLLVKESLLYMYLSQLMSTFTNLSKSASSS